MRAEDLCRLGTLAIQEHEAWEARNKARRELQEWKRDYHAETGEYFHDGEGEMEDDESFEPIKKTADDAQRSLTTARCATRRLAKKLRGSAP